MPEQDFKRNTAYKLRINDILIGKPIINNERFSFLELGNKKIVRVNIVGNVVDKYNAEGEKKYIFLTIDDGSNQIKLKAFGDDSEKLQDITQGQTILVIGVLRYFNNEIYISPEIVKNLDTKYLLVRKLELEKSSNSQENYQQNSSQFQENKEKTIAIKDSILEMIKQSEEDGGIDLDKIIMSPKLNSTSPDIINQEIKSMLEQGIIFEPRPGRVRYLG